jgi:regulator of sigma E protease
MTVLISAVAFFLLITGLVLIHELGHFLVAKKAGVTVEEFGFGLPPRAATLFRWRGTDFTLNWIPFGGFVRLKGENAATKEERKQKGSFSAASIPWRCAILVAGVAMNFLLAFCIFVFGFSAGQWIPTYLSLEEMQAAAQKGEIHLRLGVVIDDVLVGGGAADAEIPNGSVLLSVDGQPVTEPSDVVDFQKGKRTVTYSFKADTVTTETRTAVVRVEEGKTGVYLRSVPLELSATPRSLLQAVTLSVRETTVVTGQTVIGIAKLFTSLASQGTVPEGVTGIVGIAQITYATVQEGFMMYLRLVALLSLSLAVLNILPFPALDGGRLVFVLAELFIRPGSRRFEVFINTVGFAVLLLLIVLVTFYDVFRLFR